MPKNCSTLLHLAASTTLPCAGALLTVDVCAPREGECQARRHHSCPSPPSPGRKQAMLLAATDGCTLALFFLQTLRSSVMGFCLLVLPLSSESDSTAALTAQLAPLLLLGCGVSIAGVTHESLGAGSWCGWAKSRIRCRPVATGRRPRRPAGRG